MFVLGPVSIKRTKSERKVVVEDIIWVHAEVCDHSIVKMFPDFYSQLTKLLLTDTNMNTRYFLQILGMYSSLQTAKLMVIVMFISCLLIRRPYLC
jgi:hypothetical protein